MMYRTIHSILVAWLCHAFAHGRESQEVAFKCSDVGARDESDRDDAPALQLLQSGFHTTRSQEYQPDPLMKDYVNDGDSALYNDQETLQHATESDIPDSTVEGTSILTAEKVQQLTAEADKERAFYAQLHLVNGSTLDKFSASTNYEAGSKYNDTFNLTAQIVPPPPGNETSDLPEDDWYPFHKPEPATATLAKTGKAEITQEPKAVLSDDIMYLLEKHLLRHKDEHEHRHVDFEAHPEIFKGCTHVFIDAGSNRGTHIRKLFEPEKYPKSKYLKLFDKGFGTPDWRRRSSKETGICAFGFEANPRWAPTLASISEAYEKQGWRAKWFVPVFVSNNSMRTEKLWINDAGQNSDWGASGTKTESTAVSTQVPDVDLSSFLDMLNRYVDVGGYRQMKMDIEGAEFTVLPLLLQKRMLCKSTLDVLTIEWHNHAPFISDAAEMQRASSIKKDVEAHGKCTGSTDTHILTLDDESYLADGQPLPTGRS
jgi:hypothetical protein